MTNSDPERLRYLREVEPGVWECTLSESDGWWMPDWYVVEEDEPGQEVRDFRAFCLGEAA